MLLQLVRFFLGLFLGVVLWTSTAASYNQFLAGVTAPAMRLDGRFARAELTPAGASISVSSPEANFPASTIPANQLTYNVILLLALFASNCSPLSGHNLKALSLSLLLIMAVHPVGLLVSIESTYAARMGAWSESHYGTLAANAWLIAEMFYRLVGMFGLVFLCWWWARNRKPAPIVVTRRPVTAEKRKRRKK